MERIVHSTDGVAPPRRADYWSQAITQTYFPLQLQFRDAARFSGRLENRTLGTVSLSRLATEPAQYERRPNHISGCSEEEFLITIPRLSPVEFRQMGREVRCDPGGFILERGDEPYRFSYGATNELCVLKVTKKDLAEKIRNPDRFCAKVFDARGGVASLFTGMVQQLQAVPVGDGRLATVLGRQMLELLSLTLDQTAEPDEGVGTVVRAAHLRRAEQVILSNLSSPNLSPEMVADACGISKRYLHELFSDTNTTVSQFIREQRLIAARDEIAASDTVSLAETAYRFGFSDQAQFSRLFKAMFGATPSGFRAQARARVQ
ncbi:MAG: helix-turn-helix domain-containing protein [Rhodobacter sp.]|nr:helix-turn-helix domain-containing protein [Paracoccaceae bacterium]MCC0077116.1 helix-turn-helix domain-containing protein [Rhodobacter sp.]